MKKGDHQQKTTCFTASALVVLPDASIWSVTIAVIPIWPLKFGKNNSVREVKVGYAFMWV